MGIIKKQAKNIIVKVKNKHIVKVGGTLTKMADKISIEATNGKLTFASNKKINIISEKGIKFANYTPPEERENGNLQIVEVQFIDKNNTILTQSNINGVEGGNATDFIYGKKLKIKIITKETEDRTKIDFKLKGNTKSPNQNFFGISKLNWELELKNNECETEYFTLPILWYSEDFEKYDYTSHKTTIKTTDLNAFMVEISLGAKTTYLPKKENWLKPIAYRRNYEELIGLLKTDNSEDKDLSSNYENKFISSNSEILSLIKEFSRYLQTENLKINDIKKRVETDTKQLWDLAVKQVQGGNLDDRPLYWSRNKMQVLLKRHSLFENDIDFKTSIIIKNTELNKIIIVFEELSRNYTGVDFSKVPSGIKKVIITGFDPFILDPTKSGNPLQSNPSGVNALALHNKNIGNYYVQTFITPVRYKDFDEFKDSKGVIEKFVAPLISQVDMIITVSQGGVFRFDVDRFPAKYRGGYKDNMFWGNKLNGFNGDFFKQLNIGGKEFYETTLPYKKIVPNVNIPSDIFWVYFNQTYNKHNGGDSNKNKQGTVLRAKLEDVQVLTSTRGSGGAYLSNEIFYRVAKLRAELKPNLPTGHLHVPLIQTTKDNIKYYRSKGYRNANKLTIDINPLTDKLVQNIIKKIK